MDFVTESKIQFVENKIFPKTYETWFHKEEEFINIIKELEEQKFIDIIEKERLLKLTLSNRYKHGIFSNSEDPGTPRLAYFIIEMLEKELDTITLSEDREIIEYFIFILRYREEQFPKLNYKRKPVFSLKEFQKKKKEAIDIFQIERLYFEILRNKKINVDL